MKHLGLFEGIGGFSLAARWMGWETVAWCEWNEFGQKVLKHHFPEAEGHGDITKTDFTKYANKIDILTGGFPCQPYSAAGLRKGTEDERHLWPEMLRAIREIQPSYVVGENVRGITNWNGGVVFDEIQSELESQSYEVLPFLLPACATNAPHQRERIWFIAYSNERRLQKGNSGLSKVNRVFEKAPNEFTRIITSQWSRGKRNSGSVCRYDGIPHRLDAITFSKWRAESIKAYGNAIVPQVAYEIYKAIQQYEDLNTI